MRKTVFVGLSGGVDSSVAALRLIKQGYNVVGVFIKVWHPDWLVCNWEQERLDAMRVAAHIGIPFLTCDAEAAYRDAVAAYFIESYKNGLTPNPDVLCNREVKFGAFLKFALEKGADFVATGHYARKAGGEASATLLRGIDNNKDQSYFLWSINSTELEKILFPVGDTTKDAIREEATAAGLPTASKKDSQGVCFLGHIDIRDFLSHYIDLKYGKVLNSAGEVIGEHHGAFIYTIGQRHGFTIYTAGAHSTPHYVIKKDIENNTITVDTNVPLAATGRTFTLRDVVWRSEETPTTAKNITAQFRYRQKPFAIEIVSADTDSLTIKLNDSTEEPAAGQSCVLYQGEVCLGGGMIL